MQCEFPFSHFLEYRWGGLGAFKYECLTWKRAVVWGLAFGLFVDSVSATRPMGFIDRGVRIGVSRKASRKVSGEGS